jgi:hypothetical protein
MNYRRVKNEISSHRTASAIDAVVESCVEVDYQAFGLMELDKLPKLNIQRFLNATKRYKKI